MAAKGKLGWLLWVGVALLAWAALNAKFTHHHVDVEHERHATATRAGGVELATNAAEGTMEAASASARRDVTWDVLATVVVALACCVFGAVEAMPALVSIKGMHAMNRVTREQALDRPSFRRYGARARLLAERMGKSKPSSASGSSAASGVWSASY